MPIREVLDLDVLIVGGGPAGLSAAIRLATLQKTHGGDPLTVAVVEKAREPGAHSLSGAVFDPSALQDLVPDFMARGAPLSCPVRHDSLVALTRRRSFRAPFTPPPLSNHGCYVISINELVKWLAAEAEAAGVELFRGFSAVAPLRDGTRVTGVRLGDRGLDRRGQPLPSFEPGADIHARITIFCDGVRGNLTKTLVRDLGLDAGRSPQVYAIGVKELWELPAGRLAAGSVTHTLGFPLGLREFGGGFIYGASDRLASVGLVCGLEYRDPMFDPFVAFQRFKQHPFVSRVLSGGQMVRYGAKALPEGGWHAIPRLFMDGALVAGDAGGFVNSLRLKGIHLAMRTGMLAAETAFEALRANDTSASRLSRYEAAIDASGVRRELYPVRHVHQAFEHGLLPGLAFAAWSLVAGGGWPGGPARTPGHARMRTLAESHPGRAAAAPSTGDPVYDRRRTFDRLSSVHYSGTHHREDQPGHLLVHDTEICRTRCLVEYGNPCTRFCPASVYEMVDDGRGGRQLHMSPSNCVHCKTCDIMDPYQIIDWVPPEGGDGPQFDGL